LNLVHKAIAAVNNAVVTVRLMLFSQYSMWFLSIVMRSMVRLMAYC